ncbi:hypothetical protein CONCODRAFT_8466 [Conidiobolus coronatus NRRL 28638]|uniref:Uncharacterized protein n=1 Tax=Conidiobolus coronatus (strain ATCC 28846 / CBS 209.66 / NRRL 28638) TaxID=796925 RepID=A0A137P2A1_CONC2|nr:hypothetical protein CONCODRAFT_8466 [Conidiobolus coronatus NRRL 28638]|eukprot:KXN69176.1 hypothetical protein CONCODRAFT_8466 [Conidiobolus coronatus NRRL 28638]
METIKYSQNPDYFSKPKLTTKRLPKYNVKCSLFQFLVYILEIIVLIVCIVLIVSNYILITPELNLKSTSLLQNPRNILSLQNFPQITINSNINAVVSNWNLIPLPISFDVRASINSDDPADKVIVAQVRNFVLLPRRQNYATIPITANLNLFQDNMKSLLQLLDACGMLGQDRTMIKINVYADAYIGYWPIAIPVKNLNFKGQYLPCPMSERSLGEIALLAANQLLPYEGLYNGTENDIAEQETPTYDTY